MNLILIDEGQELTIWAACSDEPEKLDCPALEYLDSLLSSGQSVAHKSMMRAIHDLADGHIGGRNFNTQRCAPEGDGIYALKNHQGARLLFFYLSGRMAVISHGYPKKSAKLPAGEKKRAVDARDQVRRGIGD